MMKLKKHSVTCTNSKRMLCSWLKLPSKPPAMIEREEIVVQHDLVRDEKNKAIVFWRGARIVA